MSTIVPTNRSQFLPRVWTEPVRGDRMFPTLQHDRDFVVARATDTYEREGLYLISMDIGDPAPTPYYVRSALNGKRELELSGDNKLYSTFTVDLKWFASHVVGYVIADIKARDSSEMRALTASA